MRSRSKSGSTPTSRWRVTERGAQRACAAHRQARPPFRRDGGDGGVDITRAPEAVTGRAISYVGSSAYLFPASVREKSALRPEASADFRSGLRSDALREHEFHGARSRRTGGCVSTTTPNGSTMRPRARPIRKS